MIRDITEKDLEKFLEIAGEYLGEESLENWEKYFQENPGLFLGYFSGNELIGIIFGHLNGKEAIIDGIAVLKEFWGEGIGRKLVLAFEKRAKELGAIKASVGAAIKPTSVVGFYEKCGYHVIKKKQNYWVMEENLS